jgi:predicted transcriptional regulator
MSSSLSSAASSSPSAGAMLRTQIYLSEAERQGLQALALRSGRSQSALIREAIDAFLQQQQPQGRLSRLRQARGLWAERTDLPDWSALRGELDRSMVALKP